MNKLTIFLLAIVSLFAQVPKGTVGGVAGGGGGGGGATDLSGLTDLKVTRGSGTVLNIAAGAARIGATTTTYAAATATLSGTVASSTAFVYITSAGVLTVGHNGAATITCSGCTTATGVTAVPNDAIPLASATYTSSQWDVSGVTLLRSMLSRDNLTATDGGSVAFTATGVQVGTDSATVPRYYKDAGVPAIACTQGRDFYLDTTNGSLYQCTATNTWAQVGGLDSVPYTRVLYNGLIADSCDDSAPNDPTTLYTIPANTLEVGDILEIEMQHQKTTTNASATNASLFINSTNISASNAMGTSAGEGWAQNRAIARITSSTEASVIGLRQRSNGSVGGLRTNAFSMNIANTNTVGALATTCGGSAIEVRAIVKVTKSGSR